MEIPQRTPRWKYPLRRIIDWYNDGTGIREVLECGHEQRRLEDIYGPTNAERRRCRKCYRERQETAPEETGLGGGSQDDEDVTDDQG